MKALRSQGICPKAHLLRQQEAERLEREALEQERLERQFTVGAMVELYLTQYIEDRWVSDKRNPDKKKKILGARKPKGQSEVRRTLYGDAGKVLGDKVAAEATRKDVVQMIKAIVDRGANVQAGNVLRELNAAYEYAIGLEYFDDGFANPALLARASLKQAKVKLSSNKGKRALNDAELKKLLAWLPRSGFSRTQKQVLQFALWTGCRTGEVCNAAWKDIDFDKATMHIKDSKNGSDRYVQLSTQAMTFFKAMRSSTATYVFPSSRTGLPIKQKC